MLGFHPEPKPVSPAQVTVTSYGLEKGEKQHCTGYYRRHDRVGSSLFECQNIGHTLPDTSLEHFTRRSSTAAHTPRICGGAEQTVALGTTTRLRHLLIERQPYRGGGTVTRDHKQGMLE